MFMSIENTSQYGGVPSALNQAKFIVKQCFVVKIYRPDPDVEFRINETK